MDNYSIALGDEYTFEIANEDDPFVRGFDTKLAAVDRLLQHLEADRVALNRSIAKAKRMRRILRTSGETK